MLHTMSKKSEKSSVNNDDYDNQCLDVRSPYSVDYNDYKETKDKTGMKRKLASDLENISESSSDTDIDTRLKSPWPTEGEYSRTSEKLYGLKPEFLESLGIKPPLDKWIHVSNFRCDKSELKEILELPGRVVICAVTYAVRDRFAKVMYSHPLEAVQAVSMLKGQTFYGQKLKVKTIRCPTDSVILPKGLNSVGPGLGVKGKPLLDVVKHYKKFSKRQESMLDPLLFSHDSENWFSGSTDSKKIKLSKVSDSYIDDDAKEKDREDFYNKRIMSCQVKTIDEFEDSNDSTETVIIARKSKSPDTKTISVLQRREGNGGNLQIRRSIQNPVPSNSSTGSFVLPVGAQQVPVPQNFIPNNPGPIGPPGVNPGVNMGPVGPGMNVNLTGPQFDMNACGPPGMMNPPGFNMGPSGPGMMNSNAGPGWPAGPPGIMNPGPPGMGDPGPVIMNLGPGPNPAMNMNGPGFVPQHLNAPQAMPNAMPAGMGPRPTPAAQIVTPDSFGLEFRNLPPSTTFPLLGEKVSRCGQMLALQLTAPGCAIARFSTRGAAERCFQVFNGLRIDGCIIEVRYI